MNNNFIILMSDNRPLNENLDNSDYNSLTVFLNYKYSEQHNYGFVYYNPLLENKFELNNCISPSKKIRHSSWSKLLSTYEVMKTYKEYTHIIYLDSDCIFDNNILNIEDYLKISKNIENQHFYFGDKIIFMNNKPWNFDLPCAGFYIIPNNDFFLKMIIDWYSNEENEKYNLIHPWEQIPLQFNLLNKYRKNIEIIDDWMFREKNNQFLRHIGSEEKQNRIPFFKQKIYRYYSDIEYKSTITFLKNKTNSFDTMKINFN